MTSIRRRDLLKWAGAGGLGVAVGAGNAGMAVAVEAASARDTYAFKAVAGLPQGGKMPEYCSLELSGFVHLAKGTGTITRSMWAGYPAAISLMPWVGFTQVTRVTSVRQSLQTITIHGVIDDRTQLQRGESAHVTITIDRAAGRLVTAFAGSPTTFRLT